MQQFLDIITYDQIVVSLLHGIKWQEKNGASQYKCYYRNLEKFLPQYGRGMGSKQKIKIVFLDICIIQSELNKPVIVI